MDLVKAFVIVYWPYVAVLISIVVWARSLVVDARERAAADARRANELSSLRSLEAWVPEVEEIATIEATLPRFGATA